MNLYCIIFGFGFLIYGIGLALGKAPKMIKALREMPEEEKSKLRIDLLGKNMACVFLSAAIIFILSGFSSAFKDAAFIWCMVAWLVGTGLDIAYISKSNRYKTEK